MFELFPLIEETKSTLDIIRDNKAFDKEWFTKAPSKLAIPKWTNSLFQQDLGLFKNAKTVSGNGHFPDGEFPAIKKAILEVIHPDRPQTEAEIADPRLNQQYKTNRHLVEEINSDPPVHLEALKLAILNRSQLISTQYQMALALGWIHKSKHKHHERKRGQPSNLSLIHI